MSVMAVSGFGMGRLRKLTMTHNEAIEQVVIVTAIAAIPLSFAGIVLKLPLLIPALISFVIGFVSLWIRAATEKGKNEN